MKQFLLTIFVALGLAAGAARAQEAWVQIEALPTLTDAEERARGWASAFPEVNGFRLASGWYAIALGPYAADQAASRLFSLRGARLIPQDSFVSDGGNYASRFWPVGGAAAVPAQPEAPQADTVITLSPPQPLPLPDETPAEARRSEALLSAEERRQLQTALQWFGFYDSAIDGAFGRGTRASMAAWQGAMGYEETGILTTVQRAALMDAYRGELDKLGFRRVVEDKAGIGIEMPTGLVEFEAYAPPFVRYSEANGSGVQLLLISQEGTQTTLDGLFDLMQTLEIVPLEGFRERQGDSFVLTGQNAEIHSYTFARYDEGAVKGFTLVYPPEDEALMQKAARIMRESLVSTGPALDSTLGGGNAAQGRDLLSGLEIRKPERTRSGVFVDGQGAVLTVAEAVLGCARVTLDDIYEARLVTADPATGLALLRPDEPLAPLEVARLAPSEPRIGARAAVAGFPFGGALPSATVTFGTVEDVAGLAGETGLLRLQAETEPGEAGGPVFDPAGRVAGVLLPAPSGSARQLPPGVRFAAKADRASAFLSAQGIRPETVQEVSAVAPEDITRAAMSMTVLVSCWN